MSCWLSDYNSLRVNIYDSEDSQFTIPPSVISRPPPPNTSYKHNSDLVFNYESSPFAFWITRRSQPAASSLFDTRVKSLPTVPAGRVVTYDSNTVFEAFPFIFEEQYLQVILFRRSL
jgi:alpha-glucosidase